MDTTPQATLPISPEVKFNLSFTDDVDKYIKECQDNKIKPTVKGFATRLGTDLFSINAWANKKKKDDKGNQSEELARPKFNAAIKKLHELEKIDEKLKLNLKQEMFCKLYATNRELFGNATQSYCVAYGIDSGNKEACRIAASSAFNLLINTDIQKRINELLQAITDEMIDQELAYVALQRFELPSKVAAIREFNKLKGRITEKIDHTTKGKELPTPILGGATNVHSDNSTS